MLAEIVRSLGVDRFVDLGEPWNLGGGWWRVSFLGQQGSADCWDGGKGVFYFLHVQVLRGWICVDFY